LRIFLSPEKELDAVFFFQVVWLGGWVDIDKKLNFV